MRECLRYSTVRVQLLRAIGAGLLATAALIVFAPLPAFAQILPGGTCVNDVTNRKNNCTANDVSIAAVDLLPDSADVSCTSPQDTVTVHLRARLKSTAKERYDIGIFVARDGGNAYSGQCAHDYLHPISADNSNVNVTSGIGPFYNGQICTGNTCGDIQQGVLTYYDLPLFTLPCRDHDGDGYLDVSAIVSWDNVFHMCTSAAQAVPNTKAKCSADQALRIPIVVPPGEVEIIKVPDEPVVNAGDQIGFTIVISNTQATPATNVRITDTLPPGLAWRVVPSANSTACSIAGGVLICNWGTLNPGQSRQVRIVAPTSVADCGPVENIAYLSYLSGSPAMLKYGQAEAISGVACANIEVDKITDPGGAAQPFNFRLRTDATLLEAFTLTDTQPVFVSGDLTPTMTYIVEEIVPPGWQNTGAHCDNGDAPISVRPVTSAVRNSPELGSTVLCTFTNTQLASVEMVKTAVGGSGTFHFALNGVDFGDDFRTVSVSSGMTGSVT
ncbi:MAG: DUF11 domain-containing protein [Caldilineaceae bacterium]